MEKVLQKVTRRVPEKRRSIFWGRGAAFCEDEPTNVFGGECRKIDVTSKQVKKNATSCLLDRFAGRNEASGKPASFGGRA